MSALWHQRLGQLRSSSPGLETPRCPAAVCWNEKPLLPAFLTTSRYQVIRIDNFHYCGREDEVRALREQRARRSKNRSRSRPDDDYVYDPKKDPAADRLALLNNTLLNKPQLGQLVINVKLAYTLREYYINEIARLVHFCPNLQYIDLPDGFFKGLSNCGILQAELRANCSNYRMMKFLSGAERDFNEMTRNNPWPHLQSLTIESAQIDLHALRRGIAGLQYLTSLVLKSMPGIGDALFNFGDLPVEFPCLSELELHSMPRVTHLGLCKYLEREHARSCLIKLTLNGTGVAVPTLSLVLERAPALFSLTVMQVVKAEVAEPEFPHLLNSRTLQNLHYDICTAEEDDPLASSLTEPYYNFIRSSILHHGFPNLAALFCRDPEMPQRLMEAASLLTLPKPAFLAEAASTQRMFRPFTKPFEIYTLQQGHEDFTFSELIEWSQQQSTVSSPTTPRPTSAFTADWEIGSRKSIIVPEMTNGMFHMSINETSNRPSSSDGRRGSTASGTSGGMLAIPTGHSDRLQSNYGRRSGSIDARSDGMLSPDDLPEDRTRRSSWWSTHLNPGVGARGSSADLWR
jgi:hypothetical protein